MIILTLRAALRLYYTAGDGQDLSPVCARAGPNRLGVPEADDEPSIHQLKDTAFGLHRSVCGLIEEATHLPIAVR